MPSQTFPAGLPLLLTPLVYAVILVPPGAQNNLNLPNQDYMMYQNATRAAASNSLFHANNATTLREAAEAEAEAVLLATEEEFMHQKSASGVPGNQVCFPGTIPKVAAQLRVKIGNGNYAQRRIWMGKFTYTYPNPKNPHKDHKFGGINILVWPQNLEPGTATMENVKLHAIADLNAFDIKDANTDGRKYKAQVLVLNKTTESNRVGMKTKVTLGTMEEIKIRPRQTSFFSKGPNEKLNYWSWFFELENCIDHFKFKERDQAGKILNWDWENLAHLKKYYLDSGQDGAHYRAILEKLKVTKKDKFGNTVEKMTEGLKKKFEKNDIVKKKNDNGSDYTVAHQRGDFCYYDLYSIWNGMGFAPDNRLLHLDPKVYADKLHEAMSALHVHYGDIYAHGQPKLKPFRGYGEKKKIQFRGWGEHDNFDLLDQYLKLSKKEYSHKAGDAIFSSSFIQIIQTEFDNDMGSPHSIRVTIIPGKTKDKKKENAEMLWKIVQEAFTNKDSQGKRIFRHTTPSWAKVMVPRHERTDGIILAWSQERLEPNTITYYQAKRRIKRNRETYEDICKWLSRSYDGKLYSPNALPPFQFRMPGCPASIASYCGEVKNGGINCPSFGVKLCSLVAEKGDDVDKNVLQYADSGAPMEEFWTFADYMKCNDPNEGRT